MYGTKVNNEYSKAITKPIKVVKLYYSTSFFRDIEFDHGDGTSTKVCDCDSSSCPYKTEIALTGNLIGLATKFFDGSVELRVTL
jgi:hypothetical protein